MKIKNQPFPLYYTLYTPENFDFGKTEYTYMQNDELVTKRTQPDFVEMFKTHNSNMIRIASEEDSSFIIKYSFRPTGNSTIAIKIGLGTLSCIASSLLVFKWIVLSYYSYSFVVIEKHVEVGLFVIGASLILPQLTNNDSIRIRYAKYHLVPIVMGGLLFF